MRCFAQGHTTCALGMLLNYLVPETPMCVSYSLADQKDVTRRLSPNNNENNNNNLRS